jgi:CheY-like chemotaxis protein
MPRPSHTLCFLCYAGVIRLSVFQNKEYEKRKLMTTILCINGEPILLELCRAILERDGYEVLTTTTSRGALTILASQPIDLVIQDFLQWEDMNGFGFLKSLKSDEKLRDVPVLAIIAVLPERCAGQLEQIGLDIDRDLDGFIVGPFYPHELLHQIQAILSKRSDDTAS